MPSWKVEAGGARADLFLGTKLPGRGRKALAEAFAAGKVRVNGRPAKKGQLLAAGDVVEMAEGDAPPDAAGKRPIAERDLPLEVLHVDASMVVVAKPPGMPSHPLRAGETGTLANALVARYPECGTAGADPREAGLAHRLDAGTSGVLVAARTAAAWKALRAAFHEGRVTKTYLALVRGEVGRAGELDAPIAQDKRHPGRVVVCAGEGEAALRDALPAMTRWEPERRFRGYTLLRCQAETGRMHQLRAHLAFVGTPVVGDAIYGEAAEGDPPVVGHFLHAVRLELDGRVFEAPLPEDRRRALELLSG